MIEQGTLPPICSNLWDGDFPLHPSARLIKKEHAMKDIMGIMKQVQDMQSRMQQLQEELGAIEIEGKAGAGLVTIIMSGKGEIKRVKIDPSLMKPDEVEILEDLIVAAGADAKSKVETRMQEKMAEVTGGLPLPPGMKLF
jgi:DNA-binding YbaB/EbfC family protein